MVLHGHVEDELRLSALLPVPENTDEVLEIRFITDIGPDLAVVLQPALERFKIVKTHQRIHFVSFIPGFVERVKGCRAVAAALQEPGEGFLVTVDVLRVRNAVIIEEGRRISSQELILRVCGGSSEDG